MMGEIIFIFTACDRHICFRFALIWQSNRILSTNDGAIASLKEEIKDRQGKGKALDNLGFAYSRLGDYKKAIDTNKIILAPTYI